MVPIYSQFFMVDVFYIYLIWVSKKNAIQIRIRHWPCTFYFCRSVVVVCCICVVMWSVFSCQFLLLPCIFFMFYVHHMRTARKVKWWGSLNVVITKEKESVRVDVDGCITGAYMACNVSTKKFTLMWCYSWNTNSALATTLVSPFFHLSLLLLYCYYTSLSNFLFCCYK